MIKICHMTITDQKAIPRLLRESASATDAGMQVTIISPGESYTKDGVAFIGVTVPQNRLQRMLFVSREVYRQALLVDADIYQIHDPELLRFAGRLLRRGKKVIFDSHENYFVQITEKEYIPRVLRKIVATLYYAYETRVVRRVDATLIPCTFNGENIFENRAKRVIIVANYPLQSVFAEVAKGKTCDSEYVYVCYAGLLSEARGITQLIKAAHASHVKLVLAGKHEPPAYRREVEAMAESACVDYRGTVSMAELANIYKGALAGMCTLLPCGQHNTMDTLQTKTMEYWAVGLPVVLSNFPYTKAVMDRYHAGICVDPTDETAIADAITYLRKHPDEARQMGENGRRAVNEEFSWEVEGKKLITLYYGLDGMENERI